MAIAEASLLKGRIHSLLQCKSVNEMNAMCMFLVNICLMSLSVSQLVVNCGLWVCVVLYTCDCFVFQLTGLILITLAFLACLLLLVMYKALWYDQLSCPEGFILKVIYAVYTL